MPWGLIIIVVLVVCVIVYVEVISRNIKNKDKQLTQSGFVTTRTVATLRIDDKNKKWCLNSGFGEMKIYDFAEIVDCKIEENSVLNKVNKFGVYIYTLNNGALYIDLIGGETKRDSPMYQSKVNLAQQIYAAVQSMKAQPTGSPLVPVPTIPVPTNSVADNNSADDIEEQLKKFKSMVDSGIITQEDYEAKKKQLLGL